MSKPIKFPGVRRHLMSKPLKFPGVLRPLMSEPIKFPPRAMPGEPGAPGLVGVILTISHDTLWLPWHRLAVAMT